ncbi:ankyrin repeat and LEM domain-containing protein 1 [Leptosomus discolor]
MPGVGGRTGARPSAGSDPSCGAGGTGVTPRGRRSPEELTPLHVAASRGCRRCLGLLLREKGDPQLREQVSGDSFGDGDRALEVLPVLGDLSSVGRDGRRAIGLALEWTPWDSQHTRGWPPTEVPGGAGRSPSFRIEGGIEGSISSGLPEDISEDGPLCSTHRSLLNEPELGGSCGLGEPLLWQSCPPSPSLALWPQIDPRDSALPPQPLASSTLLSAGDDLGEGPRSRTVGGRMGGPPWALPEPSAGDSPSPSPQREFGPGGSLSSPQPQRCSRGLRGHGASPRAPPLHGGLSGCSVACRSSGDGDIPGAAAQHRPGVPRGPAVGRAGLGIAAPAAPDLGIEVGAGGWDRSSLGDSSGASEGFVSAVETLEPSEAGGCPGAQHLCSPLPSAAEGLELGEDPSPTGAATWELPPTNPPNVERVRGEDFLGGPRAAPCCDGDVGEVLAQLQGCSLRGSPPRTPGPLHSPASVTTGDVTSWGQDPPRDRHVTPRTKSRLQARAARLDASSSSSLFDETLEMPRRPPRLRAPQGVPRDPATASRHCASPRGEDVSSGDGEGTGSLDDTEILPGVLSQPRSPLAVSSSPGSSPMVLLVPGDHDHPQDSPSDAQGSPGSSPTGSPRAASSPKLVLEDGSGWQDPPPLGTHQPPGPGSTLAEPGSSAVPLSPTSFSARHVGEHPADQERGQAPTEQLRGGTEATTSPEDATARDRRGSTASRRPLSDEALRRRLRALGDDPGPVTALTRRLYLRRLEKLGTAPSWQPRCRPAASPTAPRMSWCWPGSSTAPTGAGAGAKGWSSPASTTSSSTREPAAPLPPPEPGRVLQDLRPSHLLRGQGDTRPALPPPRRGAEPAPHRDAEGLPQGATHPGDLGERAGGRLGALLPEHRPGGGVHAGGLPGGGSGAADHHQPEEGQLLRRGGELAGGAAPAPGRSPAAQGHEHLPGRGRAAAPAGGHPGWAMSTLGCWAGGGGGGRDTTPPACTSLLPCPRRRLSSGCGFYVVNTGEIFFFFYFSISLKCDK